MSLQSGAKKMDEKNAKNLSEGSKPDLAQGSPLSDDAALELVLKLVRSEKENQEFEEVLEDLRKTIFFGKILFGPAPGASNLAISGLPIPIEHPFNIKEEAMPKGLKISFFEFFRDLERSWNSKGYDMRVTLPPGYAHPKAATTTQPSGSSSQAAHAHEEKLNAPAAQETGRTSGPSHRRQPRATTAGPRFSNIFSNSATGGPTSGTPTQVRSASTLPQGGAASEAASASSQNGVPNQPTTVVQKDTNTQSKEKPKAGDSASVKDTNVMEHTASASTADKIPVPSHNAPITVATSKNKRKRLEEGLEAAGNTKKAKGAEQKMTTKESKAQVPESTAGVDEGPITTTIHILTFKKDGKKMWERILDPPVRVPGNLPVKKGN